MCIMEVRPGQRSSTIAQAMAHNLSTIERDLDMFKPLLVARDEQHLLGLIEEGHEAMKTAYARFLDVFAAELAHDIRTHGDHDHGDHSHGNERSHHPSVHPHIHPEDAELIRQAIDTDDPEVLLAAEQACRNAERFETR